LIGLKREETSCITEVHLEFFHKDSQSIKSLGELGVHGFFPLFEDHWQGTMEFSKKSLTGKEKVQAKKLFSRIAGHRGINRKKTIVMSMSEDERNLLARAFMKMVEMKILDSKPGLQ
jgi:ribosomal protein L20A (L18A)